MSTTGDTWTIGDTIALNELGWALFGSERQSPADHRPETEAWVEGMELVIGEPGNEETELRSDFVVEVVE